MMPDINKEELYECYIVQNRGTKSLAEQFGVSRGYITKLLKQNNIPMKPKSGWVKYRANHDYFSQWSHNMAYCLGFITGDGHVWNSRPFISVNIKASDKYVVEFIRDQISPESKVRYSNGMVQMCIQSPQIVADLEKYNVNHDKTFNMKIDFDIPNEFWGDYLRGLFDAEGSIWRTKFSKDGKPYHHCNIATASKQMAADLLKRIGFGYTRIVRGKYFEWKCCQLDAVKLYDIMYKDQNCFKLLRKFNIFEEIDIDYCWWSDEENKIIRQYIHDIEKLKELLPNRTESAIITKKNKILRNERKQNS